MRIVKVIETELKTALSTSGTTMTVRKFVDSNFEPLTMADFGTFFVVVIKQGNKIEIVRCSGITQNDNGSATLTIDTNGRNIPPKLPFVGSAIGKSYSTGAEVIVTDDPYTMSFFMNASEDYDITGSFKFPNPTHPQNPATKGFVEALVIAGAGDASATAKGLTRLTASPYVTLGTCTITIATPAVITEVAHGLTVNDTVRFTTTGALPTGIVAGVDYYVVSDSLTADTFRISNNPEGVLINTSGIQSGVHTLIRTTPRAVAETDTRLLTQAQKDAMAGAGEAPTNLNRVITQGDIDNPAIFKPPVRRVYTLTGLITGFGNSTSQFDITNPSGTTFRYTWDATGTDPGINATTVPIGTELAIDGQNFAASNKGAFVVTGSGPNYFEINNPLGTIELNKTLGTGSIKYAWIKPADLKYMEVEVQGAGATSSSTNSGGGGGYARKLYSAADLAAFETWYVGATGSPAGNTGFKSMLGNGGTRPAGGAASGGDINIPGGNGIDSGSGGTGGNYGVGGQSTLGNSTEGSYQARGYGAGAAGRNGGPAFPNGTQGVIILTMYF